MVAAKNPAQGRRTRQEKSAIRETVNTTLPRDASVVVMAPEQEEIDLDGRRRHSVFFSVIEEEWPEVKRGLEERLARSALAR